MCLIIASENGTRTDGELLRNAAADNPHGIGLMWITRKGKLATWKGWKVKAIENQLKQVPASSPFVIHFRYATHGVIDRDNCHPFKVSDEVWMMHNGIIRTEPITNPAYSDTWHFAERLKATGFDTPEVIRNPENQELLFKYIGSGNKLAFLDAGGVITIVNRQAGIEHNGMWLSNSYSLPMPKAEWWDDSAFWSKAGRQAGRGKGRGKAKHASTASRPLWSIPGVDAIESPGNSYSAYGLESDPPIDPDVDWEYSYADGPIECSWCGESVDAYEARYYSAIDCHICDDCAHCDEVMDFVADELERESRYTRQVKDDDTAIVQ